jgi:hypothetical protein
MYVSLVENDPTEVVEPYDDKTIVDVTDLDWDSVDNRLIVLKGDFDYKSSEYWSASDFPDLDVNYVNSGTGCLYLVLKTGGKENIIRAINMLAFREEFEGIDLWFYKDHIVYHLDGVYEATEKSILGEQYITDAEAYAFAGTGYSGAGNTQLLQNSSSFSVGAATSEKKALLDEFFSSTDKCRVVDKDGELIVELNELPEEIADSAVNKEMLNVKLLYALTQLMKGYEDSEVNVIGSSETDENTNSMPGDTNCDSKLNAKDILLLKRAAVGVDCRISFHNADANSDGKINAKDVIQIKRTVIGVKGN